MALFQDQGVNNSLESTSMCRLLQHRIIIKVFLHFHKRRKIMYFALLVLLLLQLSSEKRRKEQH